MTNRPIIVFDSGIGGLSIYRPLVATLPDENIIYLSDPVNFPYGDKSSTWLSEKQAMPEINFIDPSLAIVAQVMRVLKSSEI